MPTLAAGLPATVLEPKQLRGEHAVKAPSPGPRGPPRGLRCSVSSGGDRWHGIRCQAVGTAGMVIGYRGPVKRPNPFFDTLSRSRDRFAHAGPGPGIVYFDLGRRPGSVFLAPGAFPLVADPSSPEISLELAVLCSLHRFSSHAPYVLSRWQPTRV